MLGIMDRTADPKCLFGLRPRQLPSYSSLLQIGGLIITDAIRNGRRISSLLFTPELREALRSLAVAIFVVIPIATPAPFAHADQEDSLAIGRWLTEDHRGVIDIERCDDGELCGRLIWFQPERDENGKPPIDINNPSPELRTKPLCGLVMLGGFKQTSEHEWSDGWIYNPENGKIYHAKITLATDTSLKLRGYIGIPLFGETQLWTRLSSSLRFCSAE